ncbi:PHD/YefM family antitoxin component YafN of YafNO toxin-antitoxin module [Afipia massiliensis]|uniref:PHD/YefM family antitoxin component YafN of YafNO toxin-antitoxin module n=1 Tax=Afipia massiliensis TaxID=211460 RepID=A0A840N3F8_9BRAD|nr:hypothetical protein [Afipia massiliensis]MBB5051276.1 PHD/YefM family antitoxin component YafN of YafNO toxin-antitoxin module [Afipia massiliensis]
MESAQAFKHLRTLIKAASATDDPVLIHTQLTMMTVIIDKAAPRQTARAPLWLTGPGSMEKMSGREAPRPYSGAE